MHFRGFLASPRPHFSPHFHKKHRSSSHSTPARTHLPSSKSVDRPFYHAQTSIDELHARHAVPESKPRYDEPELLKHSSESRAPDARKQRTWVSLTRTAILTATTGVLTVGRLALVGTTSMTVAMACNFLHVIRLAMDASPDKIMPPIPQPPESLKISNTTPPPTMSPIQAEVFHEYPNIIGASQEIKSSSPTFAARKCAGIPASIPGVKKQDIKFRLKFPKLTNKTPMVPAHGLENLPCARDRPSRKPMDENHSLHYSCKERPAMLHHEKNTDRIDQPLQQTLSRFESTTIGLLAGLTGLFAGRILAVVAVVCCWYAISYIKQMAGKKGRCSRTSWR